MKWSYYNFTFEYTNGKFILFNCRNKKILVLDNRLHELLQLDNPDLLLIQAKHPTLFNVLTNNGFISKSSDETLECFNEVKSSLKHSTTLELTINPTLDCNLNCWYCYESKNKKSFMTIETISCTKRFIERIINESDIKNLRLSFFGGEPLLGFSRVVLPLIEFAFCITQQKGINLSLMFTTNGVCLSKSVLSTLSKFNIPIQIQIPFDGNREQHNKIKHFSNGIGSYDLIIRNIKEALNYNVNLTLRCNYTLSTITSFIDFINDIRDIPNKHLINISFHRIWQDNQDGDISKVLTSIRTLLSDTKFTTNINSLARLNLTNCPCDFENHIIINFDGRVYKCTARDFNQKNSIGTIDKTGKVIYNSLYETYLAKRWPLICKECKILPICPMCSQAKIEKGSFDLCSNYHFQLENIKNVIHDIYGY